MFQGEDGNCLCLHQHTQLPTRHATSHVGPSNAHQIVHSCARVLNVTVIKQPPHTPHSVKNARVIRSSCLGRCCTSQRLPVRRKKKARPARRKEAQTWSRKPWCTCRSAGSSHRDSGSGSESSAIESSNRRHPEMAGPHRYIVAYPLRLVCHHDHHPLSQARARAFSCLLRPGFESVVLLSKAFSS